MAKCNISVAIATYNGEKYFKEQLDSILAQTLKPDEIIVSDDHSTDTTPDILKKYEEIGIIKFFSNPGKGIVSNFKNAVSKCKIGNYIALADQDDIWIRGKLEINAHALTAIDSENLPALVFSDLMVVNDNNVVVNKSFFKEIVNADPINEKLESLLFSNKVIGCTTMFNSKMQEYFNLMPTEICMHDYWLSLIGFTLGKHKYIPEPLVRYRRHSNNVTETSNTLLSKIKKELSDYLFNRRIQLDEHVATVELFLSFYEKTINGNQTTLMKKFIKLKNSPTIIKRLNSFYYTK